MKNLTSKILILLLISSCGRQKYEPVRVDPAMCMAECIQRSQNDNDSIYDTTLWCRDFVLPRVTCEKIGDHAYTY